MFDKLITGVAGHVRIREPGGPWIVDQPNAVHYGNMSWAVANSLVGLSQGFVTHMIFGSGGTTVDLSGRVQYRTPNTSLIQDPTALPYNPTYFKKFDPPGIPTGNNAVVISGEENFADVVFTTLLDFGEPINQDISDEATNEPDYVFDELALYTEPGIEFTDFDIEPVSPDTRSARFQRELTQDASGRIVTHVVFHPVKKSANRQLEIEYTLRVMMRPL